MNIKYFGAQGNILCQSDRIIKALIELGHSVNEKNDYFDFIYSNDCGSHDEAIVFKKLHPKSKLILNVLDCPIHISGFSSWLDKTSIQLMQADFVTAISETVRRDIINIFPFLSTKHIPVIYQPIKDVFYKKTDKIRSALFVGRANDPNKNFKLASEAAMYSGIKIDVVGPENPLDLYPKYSNFVNYLGLVSDEQLNEEYNKHSLTFITSWNEGICLSLPESIVCRTPVVCVNTMRTAWEFCPKEFLCENNIFDITNKVSQVICGNFDKTLENYSSHYKEMFSGKSVAKNIINVYAGTK